MKKINIDQDKLKELLKRGESQNFIAVHFNISVRTLQRKLAEFKLDNELKRFINFRLKEYEPIPKYYHSSNTYVPIKPEVIKDYNKIKLDLLKILQKYRDFEITHNEGISEVVKYIKEYETKPIYEENTLYYEINKIKVRTNYPSHDIKYLVYPRPNSKRYKKICRDYDEDKTARQLRYKFQIFNRDNIRTFRPSYRYKATTDPICMKKLTEGIKNDIDRKRTGRNGQSICRI